MIGLEDYCGIYVRQMDLYLVIYQWGDCSGDPVYAPHSSNDTKLSAPITCSRIAVGAEKTLE
jgi:hypothetical protein